MARSLCVLFLSLLALSATQVFADTLYKYRGENGEWIYTDRKPADDVVVETRQLELSFLEPTFSVEHRVDGREIFFVARNTYHAPIEVRLDFERIVSLTYPHPDDPLTWVVPANGQETLLKLEVLEEAEAPLVEYGYRYLLGDPAAVHDPGVTYLAPVSIGARFPVTQAYPDAITHNTLGSVYAVDIAMPIGSNVRAARDGVVIDVVSQNFRGGTDPERDGASANEVKILHSDGTFSVYAHLNWNTIRVKPGDRVRAGQYIADSGNTGFSTGPHLHFAVQRNTGLRLESLPVVFRGRANSIVEPKTGEYILGIR